MKTKIFLGIAFSIFTMIFSWALSGPRMLLSNDPQISYRNEKVYYRDGLFTGVLVERYPSEEVYKQTHYIDGVKEGTSKEFAIGGQLRVQANYHKGLQDGVQRAWYVEGPKRYEFNYKDGLLEGPQTEWHMNGTVFRFQNFIQGVAVDKKILYQSGEVFTNYIKRNDRIYGIDGGALCFEPPRAGEKL